MIFVVFCASSLRASFHAKAAKLNANSAERILYLSNRTTSILRFLSVSLAGIFSRKGHEAQRKFRREDVLSI